MAIFILRNLLSLRPALAAASHLVATSLFLFAAIHFSLAHPIAITAPFFHFACSDFPLFCSLSGSLSPPQLVYCRQKVVVS